MSEQNPSSSNATRRKPNHRRAPRIKLAKSATRRGLPNDFQRKGFAGNVTAAHADKDKDALEAEQVEVKTLPAAWC